MCLEDAEEAGYSPKMPRPYNPTKECKGEGHLRRRPRLEMSRRATCGDVVKQYEEMSSRRGLVCECMMNAYLGFVSHVYRGVWVIQDCNIRVSILEHRILYPFLSRIPQHLSKHALVHDDPWMNFCDPSINFSRIFGDFFVVTIYLIT